QQRGHRGRTAAVVVLLRDRGAVARGLQAGDLQRVAAAVGHAHFGPPRQRHGRNRQPHDAGGREADPEGGAGPAHGPDPPNCTFTAVPFWISTFAPLFWMTVLMPAALPKAPPVRVLGPPTVPTAVLPSTWPWLSTSTTVMVMDSPPRMASRDGTDTA